MKPAVSYMKYLKNNLFEERFEVSKLRKSTNWTEDNLLKVLKSLKLKKCTDPVGLINELFKPSVAGKDVINSLLVLSNKSKYECEIPDFIELTNILSIYKNKGSTNDVDIDRGIFNVVSVRSIIDKLIYNDIYEVHPVLKNQRMASIHLTNIAVYRGSALHKNSIFNNFTWRQDFSF